MYICVCVCVCVYMCVWISFSLFLSLSLSRLLSFALRVWFGNAFSKSEVFALVGRTNDHSVCQSRLSGARGDPFPPIEHKGPDGHDTRLTLSTWIATRAFSAVVTAICTLARTIACNFKSIFEPVTGTVVYFVVPKIFTVHIESI